MGSPATPAAHAEMAPGRTGTEACGTPTRGQWYVYVNKTGGQWRMMPTDFGNGPTMYGSCRRWRHAEGWIRCMDTLRPWERQCQGRLPAPSAGCADSQRSKTATPGTAVGFDGNKNITRRKRHSLIATLGLIVAVVMTAAKVDDRQGLLALLLRSFASGVQRLRKM